MKLSTYAKKLGLHYQTAWRHYKKGLIPGAYQLPTGTVIIPEKIVRERGLVQVRRCPATLNIVNTSTTILYQVIPEIPDPAEDGD